jgi:hypothetical protein
LISQRYQAGWTASIYGSLSLIALVPERWTMSTNLLRVQLPSGITGLVDVSRPQLEEALLKTAEAGKLIASSMRSVSEASGDLLVERPAPWELASTVVVRTEDEFERVRVDWEERLERLAASMGPLTPAVNDLIRAYRDFEPTYRLGQPDLDAR